MSSTRRRNTKKNLFSEKGPSGQLDLTMVGHLVLHLIEGGIAVVLGKHGLEVGFGHGMPAVEIGPFEDLEVTEEIAESFLACVIESMVGTREPDKIRGSVVRSDTVEVVALIAIAFLVGLLFTDPCECHGDMEVDVSMIAHLVVPLFAVAVKAVTRACVKDGCYRTVDPDELTGLMVFDEDVRKGTPIESDVEGSVACARHVGHTADFGSIREHVAEWMEKDCCCRHFNTVLMVTKMATGSR